VKVLDWFKRHFALGIIIPSITCGIIATVIIERKWPWFLDPFNGFFQAIWGWMVSCWTWLIGVTPVYRWWYGALLISFAATALFVTYILIEQHLSSTFISPLKYTQDTFYGVVWRWRNRKYKWHGSYENDIVDLSPFCPICDRGLHGDRTNLIKHEMVGIQEVLVCQEHGIMHYSEYTLKKTEGMVKNEIFLKLRNGSWKQVVEQLQSSG